MEKAAEIKIERARRQSYQSYQSYQKNVRIALIALKSEFKAQLQEAQKNYRQEITAQRTIAGCNHLADRTAPISPTEFRISNLEKCLEKTDAALARLRAGTFGICVVCGENINSQRLGACLIADKCVACKNHKNRNKSR